MAAVAGLLAVVPAGAVHAQMPLQSRQDMALFVATTRAVHVYQQSGPAGLADAINECYQSLPRSRYDKVQFCVSMDLAASVIEGMAATAAEATPANPDAESAPAADPEPVTDEPPPTDPLRTARIDRVLRRTFRSSSLQQSQVYIDQRLPRITDYTARAIEVSE